MTKRIQGGGAGAVQTPKAAPVALQAPAGAKRVEAPIVQKGDIFNTTPKMVEAQRIHEPVPVAPGGVKNGSATMSCRCMR